MQAFSEHTPTVALVTGAGRGLGRALSLELAGRGLKVAALGRAAADLESLAAEASGQILPVVADLADGAAVKAGFGRIDAELGPVDTLINNAALYPHRDILEETRESFEQTLAVNLSGTLDCSLQALARMTQKGHGRIVNVTSFADVSPAMLSAAYSVSKGAGRILTRAMRADLADRFPDIVINDWIPGALRTRMGIPEGHTPEQAAKWGATLALWHDPAISGLVFVENREQMPQLSFKRRILERVTGRRRSPRMLQEA